MSEHEHKHEVQLFIDQQAYHSANPTTGAALYALGNVQPGMELFREVTGDREDLEVDSGPEPVHLKQDEHFHSGPPKVYKIIVNGRKKEVSNQDADVRSGRRPGVQPRAGRAERAVFGDVPERAAEEPRGHDDRRGNRSH
jgi:hypothetical protein